MRLILPPRGAEVPEGGHPDARLHATESDVARRGERTVAEITLEAIQGAQRALRALAREQSGDAFAALRALGHEDAAVAGVVLGRCAIFLAGSHPGVQRIDDMADGLETMIGRRLHQEVEREVGPDDVEDDGE